MPGLSGPLEALFQNFLQNGQLPQQFSSPLQQQSNDAFGAMLNSLDQMGGQGVLDAAQPVFQRNLQQAADVQRQSGPRMASNTERLVGENSNKALQDFNLFAQNVMQQGQQNKLAALMGASGHAGQQQQLLAHMLGMAGNLGAGPAVLTQHPGFWQQFIQGLGAAGGLAAAAFARGGPVQGVGGPTSDNVPARLSPGEFVINAAAAQRLGPALLHGLNNVASPMGTTSAPGGPSPQGGGVMNPFAEMGLTWQRPVQGEPAMPPAPIFAHGLGWNGQNVFLPGMPGPMQGGTQTLDIGANSPNIFRPNAGKSSGLPSGMRSGR